MNRVEKKSKEKTGKHMRKAKGQQQDDKKKTVQQQQQQKITLRQVYDIY